MRFAKPTHLRIVGSSCSASAVDGLSITNGSAAPSPHWRVRRYRNLPQGEMTALTPLAPRYIHRVMRSRLRPSQRCFHFVEFLLQLVHGLVQGVGHVADG